MKGTDEEICEAFNRIVKGESLPHEERIKFELSETGFRYAVHRLVRKGIITEADYVKYKTSIQKTIGNRRAKKLKRQTQEISVEKARIFAHAFADGTVYLPYMLKYYNKSNFLHESLRKDIEHVYGIKPSSFMKYLSNTFVSTWYCKGMITDLLRYTPSYSTAHGSAVRIPEEIMNGGLWIKRAFLRVYMADDGYVGLANRKTGGRYFYKTVIGAWSENEGFLLGLQNLFLAFGIQTRINGKKIMLRDIGDVVHFYIFIGFQHGGLCSKSKRYKDLEKNKALELALGVDDRLNGRKKFCRKESLIARNLILNAGGKKDTVSPLEVTGKALSMKIQFLLEKGFFNIPRYAEEIANELMKRELGSYNSYIIVRKLFANFVKHGIIRCVNYQGEQLFQRAR